MGKYLSVVLGAGAVWFGLWGIGATWPLFWTAVKTVVPPVCVLGGLLAVIVGLMEIRDTLADKRAASRTGTQGASGGS